MKSPIVEYFGLNTVELAIADYFSSNGLNENVRDNLMLLSINKPEDFFDIVDDYVMRTVKIK
jgi:hypothetical protein